MVDTPDTQPSMADTTDSGEANTPDPIMPICDDYDSRPAHPSQSTMPGNDGEVNPRPRCKECIMNRCTIGRFDMARDRESFSPIIKNGVAQDSDTVEYHGLFDENYTIDWRAKTAAWKISAELRLHCDCTTAPSVRELQPDHGEAIDESCPACNKRWCMRCGDPVRELLGRFSVHAGPTYCQDIWTSKEAAREEQYPGNQGLDHQLCPRCNVHTETRDDESHAECVACHTAFCFDCGFYQEGEKIPEWLNQNHREC